MSHVLYCRVSSDEQRERQTIRTQQDFAQRWAELHGVALAHIYADDGISGTVPVPQRPAGAQLLTDAQAGQVSAVYVYRLDRLGRDARIILDAVEALERAGVRLVSMTEPFDTKDAIGRFTLTILSGVARWERDSIIARSRAGQERAVREGAWMGGPAPYGYRKVGEKKAARIRVSEEPIPGLEMSEADVVAWVYRMSAVEHLGCQAIADRLNARGVPTYYGRDGRAVLHGRSGRMTANVWTGNRIRNLLANPVYKGTQLWGGRSREEPIVQPVPAIVTPEVWQASAQGRNERMRFASRNAKRDYLLRGLIRCAGCGLTYTGGTYTTYGGKAQRYYQCAGRYPGRGAGIATGERCPARMIHESLEEIVWADVLTFLRQPDAVLEELVAEQQAEREDTARLAAELRRQDQALAAKGAERERVLFLFRRGLITEAEMETQLAQVAAETNLLRLERTTLADATARAGAQATALDTAEELLADLAEFAAGPWTFDQRRRLVELLVAGIEVETDLATPARNARVTVTYKFGLPHEDRGAQRAIRTSVRRVYRATRRGWRDGEGNRIQ